MAISVTGQSKGTKRKATPAPTTITPKVSRIDSATNLLQVPTKDFNLKICSWNVAGLRALVKKDGFQFLKSEDPDIFCLQVSKPLTVWAVDRLIMLMISQLHRKRNAWRRKFLQKRK